MGETGDGKRQKRDIEWFVPDSTQHSLFMSMNQHLRCEMDPMKRLSEEKPPSKSSTGLFVLDFKSRCEHFSRICSNHHMLSRASSRQLGAAVCFDSITCMSPSGKNLNVRSMPWLVPINNRSPTRLKTENFNSVIMSFNWISNSPSRTRGCC